MSNSVQFKTVNYLPLTNSPSWVLKDGAYLGSDGYLHLPENASVSFDIVAFKNMKFAFFKVDAVMVCSSFDAESSLDSDVTMELMTNYMDYTGAVSDNEDCAMGMSTTNLLNADVGEYKDTKVMETLNKPIYSSVFMVTNTLATELTIKLIKLYTSEDFSESQFIETLNGYFERKRIQNMKVGVSPDYSLLSYLKAITVEKPEGIKFKPYYTGDRIDAIEITDQGAVTFEYEVDPDWVDT